MVVQENKCSTVCRERQSFVVTATAGGRGTCPVSGLKQGLCAQKKIHFGFLTVSGVIKFYLSLQQLIICEFWPSQTPPRAVQDRSVRAAGESLQ